MPKVVYTKARGLVQESGTGISFGDNLTISPGNSEDNVKGLEVDRNTTLKVSPKTGISEISGSLLTLRGKDEALFFHMGGDQYMSSNAWFDADQGAWGAWKFATGSGTHSAYRWGFRSAGKFELDVANEGELGDIITWTNAMSITSSNGSIGIGKRNPDETSLGSFNAILDISGSNGLRAMAVTGSLDVGGSAPDAYFMPPRLTTAQRDNLSAKAGMMVYNTSTNKINFHNGTVWKVLSVD